MRRGPDYGDVALGVECALPTAYQAPRTGRRPQAFARLFGSARRLAGWLNGRLAPGVPRR